MPLQTDAERPARRVEVARVEEAFDHAVVCEAHWEKPGGEVLHACEVYLGVISSNESEGVDTPTLPPYVGGVKICPPYMIAEQG